MTLADEFSKAFAERRPRSSIDSRFVRRLCDEIRRKNLVRAVSFVARNETEAIVRLIPNDTVTEAKLLSALQYPEFTKDVVRLTAWKRDDDAMYALMPWISSSRLTTKRALKFERPARSEFGTTACFFAMYTFWWIYGASVATVMVFAFDVKGIDETTIAAYASGCIVVVGCSIWGSFGFRDVHTLIKNGDDGRFPRYNGIRTLRTFMIGDLAKRYVPYVWCLHARFVLVEACFRRRSKSEETTEVEDVV